MSSSLLLLLAVVTAPEAGLLLVPVFVSALAPEKETGVQTAMTTPASGSVCEKEKEALSLLLCCTRQALRAAVAQSLL